MFDIGMTELLVIGVVALIVVGPNDLPGMFRQLGRFTGKMRGMARDFQRAMEDAADESGVKDISRDLKGMANPKKFGLDKLKDAAGDFEKWDPMKSPRKAGPNTSALSEERQAERDRIQTAAAKRMEARKTAAAPDAVPEPAAPVKDTGTAADTPLTADEPKE
ncbi:Sec-independent protein translocase protein TatB [Rhodobacteraceae bacterium THAF1]|uniref:Sec-independent protein translocase protein TatB n=1 Tax=Palleronia sp. THAF1 TaxID=2587842 RepID=UPI000F3E4DB7|nr:Sec-independent protein translocase protein TatB [Palleronia sp. THAF1]QFU09374.1 Sec-independent protein translocase protein TatB [Palleronia sp. THAF1]VDC22037.1 Sec-independent protein translocase protein TatB [Rhodobacteraceae bacterium THAF1]